MLHVIFIKTIARLVLIPVPFSFVVGILSVSDDVCYLYCNISFGTANVLGDRSENGQIESKSSTKSNLSIFSFPNAFKTVMPVDAGLNFSNFRHETASSRFEKKLFFFLLI